MLSGVVHKIRANKWLFIINGVFLTIYSLICFVNHANYRTYALDLGAYTRAVYDYAHFHASYGEVFREVPENILSDHFDLLLMLFSPLWWIFGEVTLLVVQLAAIIMGSWGVQRLARQAGLRPQLANLCAVVFLSCFGIFSAVAFDYHSNVVAACAIPWLIYFFREKNRAKMLLAFIFILVAKENMALWLFFVCSGLAWMHRKEKQQRRTALWLSALSLFVFMALIFFLMPAFSSQKQYSHIEFHVLGNSFKEIILSIIRHPVHAFSLLFKNHLPDPSFNGIKEETWLFYLISGGFLMLLRPVFLWVLVPVLMQKMYHDDPTKWSVAQQYNIEFVPLLAWCLIESIRTASSRMQQIITVATLLCCLGITIRLCDRTVGFVDKNRIRFYQAGHYHCDFNKAEVKDILSQIPASARVSAQSMFVPHLINKKAVYQYPIIRNADYLLLSTDIHAWPLTPESLQKQIDSLLSSKNVQTACVKSGVYLFKIQANPVY